LKKEKEKKIPWNRRGGKNPNGRIDKNKNAKDMCTVSKRLPTPISETG
jgi:hypothetical protein